MKHENQRGAGDAGEGSSRSEIHMAVYILFEHKSSPSPGTLMQLYRYLGLIWEDEDRDRAKGKTPRGTYFSLVVSNYAML